MGDNGIMNELKVLTAVRRLAETLDKWKSDWTAERAGKLDNIDATMSSRASGADVNNILSQVGNIGGVYQGVMIS